MIRLEARLCALVTVLASFYTVPIVSATPIFTMAMGFFYFGREVITWRTVATIALIVPGVILVALGGAPMAK